MERTTKGLGGECRSWSRPVRGPATWDLPPENAGLLPCVRAQQLPEEQQLNGIHVCELREAG